MLFNSRNRTNERLEPLRPIIEKLIVIKVMICWKTLLLLKQCRLAKKEKGTEIVCKMCKFMALGHVDKKLKNLKIQKEKVRLFILKYQK